MPILVKIHKIVKLGFRSFDRFCTKSNFRSFDRFLLYEALKMFAHALEPKVLGLLKKIYHLPYFRRRLQVA